MKTAISIPDELFEEAEGFANTNHLSRSNLYSIALKEYLQKADKSYISKKLNEVYSQEEACLDPVLDQLQKQSLPKEAW